MEIKIYPNRQKYEGKFWNEKPNGNGFYILPVGEKYNGEFRYRGNSEDIRDVYNLGFALNVNVCASGF